MHGSARPRDSLPRFRRDQFHWWWPLVPIVVIAAIFVTFHLAASPPSSVAGVTFVNNTAYDVEVDVAGAGSSGTLHLGTAPARTTTVIEDVIDQGASWVVQFRAQGVAGGEMNIARADLERSGWKIVVPGDVAAKFAAAGLQPSPTQSG